MTRTDLYNKALEILKEDGEIFVNVVNELDSWNGYADGFRAFDMYELDDLHCGMSLHDFLDKLTSDFNIRDNYFYYSIYGLESTDDIEDLYRSNVDEEDLLDTVINNYSNLDLNWIDSDLDEIISEIVDYTEDEEA